MDKLVLEGYIWKHVDSGYGQFEYYIEEEKLCDDLSFCGENQINHEINRFIYNNVDGIISGEKSVKRYKITIEEIE